jgi:hypothetical protein
VGPLFSSKTGYANDGVQSYDMDTLSWKKFFEVLSFVVVFAVPVILYLMEKAGMSLIWIFRVGWLSIAAAALYLVLNIPWVWANVPTPIRIWRICLVCSFALLSVGYGAIRIWPTAKSHPSNAPLSGSTGSTPSVEMDEASRIEQLLGAVPDSAYRQLVGSVVYALDPHATLSVGNLVDTPDGVRTVDIELRSSGKDGAPLLTAIDVIDLPPGRKADITAVDAADSKRADIKADATLLCSNTGFQQDAISKAKRKNIGLISVLRQGDKRVKGVIEEEIYLRKIDINPVNITWNGDNLQNLNPNPDVLEYKGGSVVAWLQLKASLIAGTNPELTFGITNTFNFKRPTDFYKNGKPITLRSMAVSFIPRVRWLSQTVQIDAQTGIYDYVRGRVMLTPGSNSYTIKGIDFDHATPLSTPPPIRALGVGLRPGEIDFALADVYGAPAKGIEIAELDDIVRPEDLRLKLTQEELNKLMHSAH